MLLTPALMLDTNRKANHKMMKSIADTFVFDQKVVYDQEFAESDYRDGYTYIGHAPKRMGFVTPRNELLKYFYNSDFDYALWFDANSNVSGPTVNDERSSIDALRQGKIDVDCVYTTLGIIYSPERVAAKCAKDFFDVVHLLPYKTNYNWMHGMVMKNFKKYYNQELYIHPDCDPWKGTSEDIYFTRLLSKVFDCHVCPTIVVNKPNSKTSTWMTTAGSYAYPKPEYGQIDDMIRKELYKYTVTKRGIKDWVLPRVQDESIENLKEYKPRPRHKSVAAETNKSLW